MFPGKIFQNTEPKQCEVGNVQGQNYEQISPRFKSNDLIQNTVKPTIFNITVIR